MHANSMCVSCIVSKQEKLIRDFTDEDKKLEYIQKILEILSRYGRVESSPRLVERINHLYEQFWGMGEDYTSIKHQYNQLLLDKESDIVCKIKHSEDCLKECIKYVSVGNYIDFSAVTSVNEKTLEDLLSKMNDKHISQEYPYFIEDLGHAKTLVYLTDNCGEIVLDKIFMRFIKESYPNLKITAIVRGESVINDATIVDAEEVGLTGVVRCIGNGSAAPGTVFKCLSEEARLALESADVIISKGQGNFESMYGEGFNPYYIFLCKCELFVRRFGLSQYEMVFAKEERIGSL